MIRDLENIFNEHLDFTDRETVSTIVSVEEADKNQILEALTHKLYDNIVDKVDDIDFGTIPLSKGDITKVENYDSLLDCLEVIKDIVIQYHQSTEPIDVVLDAIENVKSRTRVWEKAFAINAEFPILMYNVIVLSIISSVSILIGTSIDFIKNPGDENFEASLDRVAYSKTKDNLLFQNLKKFNKACSSGDLDRSMDHVLNTMSTKNLTGTATLGTVGAIAMIAMVKNILPILQELVFFYFHAKQNVSDYFAIQGELLQSNANTLQYKEIEPAKRKEIYKRQMKIADRFKKISNVLCIKTKRAEVETTKDVKKSSKYKTSDLIIGPSKLDTAPASKSSLF